jgi:hypothetical protein
MWNVRILSQLRRYNFISNQGTVCNNLLIIYNNQVTIVNKINLFANKALSIELAMYFGLELKSARFYEYVF